MASPNVFIYIIFLPILKILFVVTLEWLKFLKEPLEDSPIVAPEIGQ